MSDPIRSACRRAEAARLRSLGWTYRDIGTLLDITPQGAQKLVKSYYRLEGRKRVDELTKVFPQMTLEARQRLKARMRGLNAN